MSFERDVERFREKTLERITKVKRLAAFELFGDIVYQTPVKNGYLRNNWFVTIGHPTNITIDIPDPGGDGTVSRMEQELALTELFKDIYFTNNLPYAYRIEFDGYSAKAPEGMVRVNALRWDKIVKKHARRVANED